VAGGASHLRHDQKTGCQKQALKADAPCCFAWPVRHRTNLAWEHLEKLLSQNFQGGSVINR